MKRIKQIISTILVICMCIGLVPIFHMNANASNNIVINGIDIGYADGGYFTKNRSSCASTYWPSGRCHKNGVCDAATSKYCNCMRYWPTGDPSTCQVDLLGSQCFAYARYCQWKVYGSYATEPSSKYADLTGVVAAESCTESYLKAKLFGCSPATHIRMPAPHSVSVISTSSSSITVTDCNYDGFCKIRVKTYTWEEFSTYVKSKGGIQYVYSRTDASSTIYHNPLGNLDSYSGGTHSLNIAGWAFDADDNNAQLEIHVYLGDTCCGVLKADQLRSDVNHVYGCGDYHGFGGTINLDKSIVGTQTFSIWAIDVGGGSNTLLGNITVNIGSDTVGPVLYNVNITKIGPTGYTVSVTPSDPSGIVRVKFPTWTEYNGQDDLLTDWSNNALADGTKVGDTYSYRVKISDHNNEYGIYYTHIYAWDQYGNETSHAVFVNLQQPDYTEVSREFGDDFYAYIENAGAGTVLTHEPTGFGNGDYDSIFTAYTKSNTQIWHFTRNEDGSYQISPKSDESLALHVVAANGARGTNVILHTATKSSAQRWFISKVDGHYFFRPACSTDCFLDLTDASLYNGVSARIWSYNGSTAQQINLGDPYAENIVAEGTYNGYLYRIYDKNMTWTEAQAFCEELGGNLASITSQGEQDYIASLIGEKGKMHQYWIGARYLDGNYVWSDGTEWSYTNWDNLEPNGIRDGQIFEEFVHMYNALNPKVTGSERFKWNDMSNGNSLETEEMYFGLHHVGFVYKVKAKCDICNWDDGVVTTEPSFSATGLMTYTCSVCSATKDEIIPALTHLPGDIDLDGDVDSYDLTTLARHVGGIEYITDTEALTNADVNNDGDIDAYDLTKHARYVGGIITNWDQE